MKRTQIQLPDVLFEAAHELARHKEISMAELVRRGLEYMLAVHPKAGAACAAAWKLPDARRLDGTDPFNDPTWRERLHTDRFRAAEEEGTYGGEGPS